MIKTNIKSKEELLKKVREEKVVDTNEYRYVAEKEEQLDMWGNGAYLMTYKIRRKAHADIENENYGEQEKWETVYSERIEDNFINIENGTF